MPPRSRSESSAALGLEQKRPLLPLVLLGVVAVAGVALLAFRAFSRSVVYYLTPTEVLASPGRQVRVSGKVVPGSISFFPAEGKVSFAVSDGTTSLKVEFAGTAPDTLKDDAEAVAEGSLGDDGIFHATKLLAKCPSKFEGKTQRKG